MPLRWCRALAPWLALALVACSGGREGGAVIDSGAPDSAVDEVGPVVDADTAGDGATVDPALDAKCTPTFTLTMEDKGPNAVVFTDAVPDPKSFVQAIGRTVCRILYRKPEEVRDANHITLLIRDDPDYPGWKAGNVGDITVMISTRHLATIKSSGKDVAAEIQGILLHEMTHMYQNDDKATGEGTYPRLGNVLEGVADFVRIRAGYPPPGASPSKTGAWDDAGYWKPAFFLLWIDGNHPDFLYRLNLGMKAGDGVAWTPAAIGDLTGTSVDALWAEYAGVTCCQGPTQTCCK